MAYDANGMWKPEDDNVSTRVTGLLKQNNPLMTQARTQGMQAANRRGLLNSSMGVQASQMAAMNAALPIASQEASQIHAKNVAAQGHAQNKELTEIDIGSKEKIAAMNVAAHDRQYAVGAMAELQKKYGGMFAEIVKNNDMSAEARQQYFDHIAALRDSDMNLLEQLYGLDLEWASPVASPTKPDPSKVPAPPATPAPPEPDPNPPNWDPGGF